MKRIGGIKEIENKNEKKAKLVYDVIDKSEGFYEKISFEVTFTATGMRALLGLDLLMRPRCL